jgi:hypothetical protein
MTEDNVSYVYKYLPFDEGSLRVIQEGTMKFTSPLDFNDPFDCRPAYDPAAVDKLWKSRRDLFKAVAAKKRLSPAKLLQQKDKMAANIRREIESGRFVTNLVRDVGVCCLSRVATDTLMWSHYANFHRGFVVEFQVPESGTLDLLDTLLVPLPVHYSETRPVLDVGQASSKDALLRMCLFTKAKSWEYECEERVIVPDRSPGIYRYDRERQLVSVIAGLGMPAADYSKLERAVAKADRQLYRAAPVGNTYRIHVPMHPRLDAVGH